MDLNVIRGICDFGKDVVQTREVKMFGRKEGKSHTEVQTGHHGRRNPIHIHVQQPYHVSRKVVRLVAQGQRQSGQTVSTNRGRIEEDR